MHRFTLTAALLLALAMPLVRAQTSQISPTSPPAQTSPPAPAPGGNSTAPRAKGPRGPAATREFLGLGAAPDPQAAERGAKLFASNCAFCHGAKASGGDTGPDLVRSSLVLHDEKGNLVGPAVHDGRPTHGMPAFPTFTADELRDIAEFLHLRVELTANRGTYKLANIVTGDPAAGERYFNREGGCTACRRRCNLLRD